jgi:hypothetical protein
MPRPEPHGKFQSSLGRHLHKRQIGREGKMLSGSSWALLVLDLIGGGALAVALIYVAARRHLR